MANTHIDEGAQGLHLGRDANSLIGLYGATPVAQQATTGTTTGFSAGAGGTAVKDVSTFTGNSGTAAYTIGDVVRALKNLGILAADA